MLNETFSVIFKHCVDGACAASEVCIWQIIASVRIMASALFYTLGFSISLSSRVSVITMAIFTKKKLTRTLSLGAAPVLEG